MPASIMTDTTLADRLRAWRGCTSERPRGGVSQRRAAELLGVSYDTIRRIERGGSFAHPALLILAMEHVKRNG